MLASIILASCLILPVFFTNNKCEDKYTYTTVLKGIAILLVIIQHFTGGWSRVFTPLGGIGVSIFLILSGYGINESVKRNGLANFWGKRGVRVCIPYFLVITILAFIQFPGMSEYLKDILYIKTSYWYVGYIIKCYLIYWTLSLVFKPQTRNLIFLIIGIISISLLDNLQGEQALSFITGVILSDKGIEIDKSNKIPAKYLIIFFWVGILFLMLKQVPTIREYDSRVLVSAIQLPTRYLIALFIIFGLAYLQGFYKNAYLNFVGVISYELYLVHFPLRLYINNDLLIAITYCVLSILFAYLFSRFNDMIIKRINNK